jgi:hypothetical protein
MIYMSLTGRHQTAKREPSSPPPDSGRGGRKRRNHMTASSPSALSYFAERRGPNPNKSLSRMHFSIYTRDKSAIKSLLLRMLLLSPCIKVVMYMRRV